MANPFIRTCRIANGILFGILTFKIYYKTLGVVIIMEMSTVRNISIGTNENHDFYLLLGDFLDAFYIADKTTQASMVTEPPIKMLRPEFVPFLAATVHKLAIEYKLDIPSWVFEPQCYLSGTAPHFALNAKGKLRLLFMYKSPSEFKHRNLFVDENVLVRV